MAPNNGVNPQQNRAYPQRHSSFGNQVDEPHNSTSTHGVVASHFLAQSANAYGRETWMDFLADQGQGGGRQHQSRANPTAPEAQHSQPHPHPSSSRYALPNRPSTRTDSSSSRGADRKRRLTTADPPLRRPSSIRMHSNNSGNSNSDPIVLDPSPASAPAPAPSPSPPLPLPPSFPTSSSTGPLRRGSDLVLPPWQPDAEVSQCPVCGKSFTFLYRKHHCRKCGRVVCATCSPHRITIPRQFIVHPPSDGISNIIDLTGDDENAMSPFGPFRNPALGGGEEVRVCNPCVPDPNYSLPPQYNPAASSRYNAQNPTSSGPSYPSAPSLHSRAYRSTSSVHDASRTVGHAQRQQPRDPSSDNRRVSYHGSTVSGERWLPPLPTASHVQLSQSRPHDHNPSAARYATPNNRQLPFNLGPGSQSVVNMFPRSTFTPVPPPAMPSQQPPRPRRQIAEEDECPICGNELPPKGPGNDDAARTQHIQECIALYSASPAPVPLTQTTSASLPTQRTRGMSDAGEGASNPNRMTHAARGMFPFIATEKDCIDAEGNEEECIICFEEYEAGDKMARLVCWCKFHEKCIKDWWEKKGRGACPTHQLHE